MTIEGISDFRPYLAHIADSGANVGILTLLGADAQRFLRQFSELGLNKSVKLAVMAFCESFLPGLNKDEVEGIITCVPFLESLDRPETRDFVERQKRMFGPETVVSYFAESHYGLVMFLKNAIEKAQSDHMEMVIDQMGDQTLTVANGEVTLRASDHHMVLNMVIAEVRGGKLMAKEYIGPVAPSNQCSGKKERK
jgi:ABC-type branched-subunit amino acid transport system substrate-binding protein